MIKKVTLNNPEIRLKTNASWSLLKSQDVIPIGAIKKVLDKSNLKIGDVDLFEINEAFAVVPMAAMKDLSLSPDIVNVHGGACALGHPVGTSGARIIATLINALEKYNLHKGIASLCIGGGEATAIAIEKF